jgi:UMF1 family MFS transporter
MNQSLSLAGTPAASPLGYYSWAFGQAARDPFYIMVVIYIFFPYFSSVVVGDPVRGQSLIGYINASVGFVLAATILFLGAIADTVGRRKPWILVTYGTVALGGFSLWWVKPGDLGLSLYASVGLIFMIMVAFAYAEVFHNAMLPSVTPAEKAGEVSGLAFALGNFGAVSTMVLVLFAFALPGVQDWSFLPNQPLFGIDHSSNEHDRIVGPIAGTWLLLFILPVLLFTPDGQRNNVTWQQAARAGMREVISTLRQLVRHYANIARYLVARMLFNDGMVGVLIFGGVYAAGNFGWETITLLIFGLTTSVSAMIGAYIGGLLDDHLGSMRTLKVSIMMSALILIVLTSITPDTLFFVIPVSEEAVWSSPYFSTIAELTYLGTNQIFALFFVTGLSASRTLMARLSPPEMATQFFGLYGLSGSVTAFLAPLLVAIVTDITQSQRFGFASLVSLILLGGLMLGWVREEQATRAPEE